MAVCVALETDSANDCAAPFAESTADDDVSWAALVASCTVDASGVSCFAAYADEEAVSFAASVVDDAVSFAISVALCKVDDSEDSDDGGSDDVYAELAIELSPCWASVAPSACGSPCVSAASLIHLLSDGVHVDFGEF